MSTRHLSDPLAYVQRRKAANVPEQQAEAQAEALRDALKAHDEGMQRAGSETGQAIHELRTDMQELRGEMRSEMQALKADLREFKAETQGHLRLHNWMLGVLIAGVVALVLKAYA